MRTRTIGTTLVAGREPNARPPTRRWRSSPAPRAGSAARSPATLARRRLRRRRGLPPRPGRRRGGGRGDPRRRRRGARRARRRHRRARRRAAVRRDDHGLRRGRRRRPHRRARHRRRQPAGRAPAPPRRRDRERLDLRGRSRPPSRRSWRRATSRSTGSRRGWSLPAPTTTPPTSSRSWTAGVGAWTHDQRRAHALAARGNRLAQLRAAGDRGAARPRRPRGLLDADLHQLAPHRAPHPRVVEGLPR